MHKSESVNVPQVLIVAERCAPSMGGLETFLDALYRRAADAGFAVTMIATKMVNPLLGNGGPSGVQYGPHWLVALKSLRRAEVVHLTYFDYRWLMASKLLGKRVILAYHSHAWICPKGIAWNGHETCEFSTHWRQCPACMHRDMPWVKAFARWLSLPLKQSLAQLMDAVVNISVYTEKRFHVPRSMTIQSGVDVDRLRPAEHPSRDYFLFYGRLIPEKGCQVLIQALAKAAARGCQVPLIIVGDGPQRAELEQLCRELRVEALVSFRKGLLMDALLPLLQHALAVVVPSIAPETFGRTAVEAMSCGTPVIGSEMGGLAESVGAVGLLCRPGDEDSLADRLIQIAQDASLQQQLSQRGRKLAEECYRMDRALNEYLQLYQSVRDRS